MNSLKRLILVGFILLWLAGFLLIAPSPIYRLFFVQANGKPLDTPYQLFETVDWTHPYYYGDLGRAFRTLSGQSTTNIIYLYLDLESPSYMDTYQRYFDEYAFVWAYPRTIEQIRSLDTVPQGATVIISSAIVPDFECLAGEENLYLCQF